MRRALRYYGVLEYEPSRGEPGEYLTTHRLVALLAHSLMVQASISWRYDLSVQIQAIEFLMIGSVWLVKYRSLFGSTAHYCQRVKLGNVQNIFRGRIKPTAGKPIFSLHASSHADWASTRVVRSPRIERVVRIVSSRLALVLMAKFADRVVDAEVGAGVAKRLLSEYWRLSWGR